MTTENQTPENVNNETPTSSPSPSKTKKIVAAVALGVIVAGGFAVSSSVDATAEKKVAEFVEKANAEGEVSISYGDVSASMGSSSVSVSDINLSEKQGDQIASIENVDVQVKGYVEGETIPYLANLSISDMTIMNQDMLDDLKVQTGTDYSDRKIDASFGYEVDEGDNLMNAQMKLGVSGINEIAINTEVSGINGAWTEIQSAYKANEGSLELTDAQNRKLSNELKSAKFNSLTVRYENKGEVEVLIGHAAKSSGLTEEEFKAQLPRAIDHYLGDSVPAEEVKKFVKNPKSLTISVAPNEPVSFSELPMVVMSGMMGQTEAVIKALNITVSAN